MPTTAKDIVESIKEKDSVETISQVKKAIDEKIKELTEASKEEMIGSIVGEKYKDKVKEEEDEDDKETDDDDKDKDDDDEKEEHPESIKDRKKD